MRNQVRKDETLTWKEGVFTCESCKGLGVSGAAAGTPVCSVCNGDGERKRECELHFDILPGTPATGMSGPPENYDPGEGPQIHKIAALIDNIDMTNFLTNVEEADEFICEEWEQPEPDYPDHDEE